MKMLCRLGLHDWQFSQSFHPSIAAPIVTRAEFSSECARCGKAQHTVMNFDALTGQPTGTIETMTAGAL